MIVLKYMVTLLYIKDFGLPCDIKVGIISPHHLHLSWKIANGPVTGYRIYCFPADSQKAEIIKDIHDGKQESAVISGLKPSQTYRVGMVSITQDTTSKVVITEHEIKMCMLLFSVFRI